MPSSAYVPPTNGGTMMPTGWELVYEPKVKSNTKATTVEKDDDDDDDDKTPVGNCLLSMDFNE